jgi:hypothetical protein
VANGQQHLADFLAARVRSGELRPHDTTAAARMLFSAIAIGQLTSSATNPKVLVDLLLNGILASGPEPAKARPAKAKRAAPRRR